MGKKKWKRIDPAEIKVGDRVRTNAIDKPDAYDFTVIERGRQWIGIFALGPDRTWYVRKPKPAKPLTRPDEPPVGTLFRVDRTGRIYQHWDQDDEVGYLDLTGERAETFAWAWITEPGDTITLLKWAEDRPRTNGDFPG